jgi:hypothetical protein
VEWCEVGRSIPLSIGIRMKTFLGFAILSTGLISICAGTTYSNDNEVFLVVVGIILAITGVITIWKAASGK